VTTETIAAETAAVKSITLETITTLLAYHAAQNPQVEAIVDHESRLTFSGLEQRSRGRATWLVANGVNKGHRVALLMQNSVEWAINAYAIMRMGAVLVPLSTLLRPPELCAQLAAAGVRHLIAVSDFRERNFHQEIAEIDRDTLPSLRNIWWVMVLIPAVARVKTNRPSLPHWKVSSARPTTWPLFLHRVARAHPKV